VMIINRTKYSRILVKKVVRMEGGWNGLGSC